MGVNSRAFAQRVDISQPTDWPLLEGLPTLAETMKDAASIPAPIDVVEGLIREDEEKRLY